ncbi:Protein SERAC1 [Eumeta japonica]|uniref:Protein SERAC1 n=1 Tax=Eumeta variegata TaxID=151549 RepID=A0A4C1WYU7_EUMVA|nr:Protein SERAC1 [Eumeta japonica]
MRSPGMRSLANTWRQGDWRCKYKIQPEIVPLRKHPVAQCGCDDKSSSRNVANNDIVYCRDGEVNDENYFNDKDSLLEDVKPDNDNKDCDIGKEIFFDRVLSKDKIFDERFAKTLMDRVKIVENYGAENFLENFLIQNIGNDDYLDKDEEFTAKMELEDHQEVDDKERACECQTEACSDGCGCICSRCYSSCWPRDWLRVDHPDCRVISINYTSDPYLWRPIWVRECKRLQLPDRAEQMIEQLLAMGVGRAPIVWVGHSKGGLFIKQIYTEAYDAHTRLSSGVDVNDLELTSDLRRRACLWHRSQGFMFYSVPHRGSPLADLNIPPITARSIELLEIRKDCSTVLELQERWLKATKESKPIVRSLVETCRTLMAVLWLRIVSEESAGDQYNLISLCNNVSTSFKRLTNNG